MMRQFVENGRLQALLIALLVVSGLSALSAIPRAEDPHIIGRVAMIITPFPGASAERVEALVTEKLENKLRELPSIEHITSTSREGISLVVIRIAGDVSAQGVKLLWSRARDLIGEVEPELPAGAGAPALDEDRNHAFTMLIGLQWQGDSKPLPDVLGRYAHELESRLRAVYGTPLVDVVGEPKEEILITVDSHRLANLGLSAVDVSNAVRGADAKIAAGQVYNDLQRFSVELQGEVNSLERVRQIPLQVDQTGVMIRIGDIASVSRHEKYPASSVALLHGQRGVVVGVQADKDLRVDRWTQRIETVLDDFNAILPANIKTEVIFSQDKYTSTRLADLMDNVLLGFSLILIVLFFTLGMRASLIVASALPLTVLFTLTVMQYTGMAINQISVTGLIVALGIMVDNAIVMVDTINHERSQGLTKVEAVQKSVRHLWLPLLGSTLTTVLAFLPIVLMPGSAGEFVGGIALSVIFSLIGSYIISHTLIAGLAGRFLKPAPNDSAFWKVGIRSHAMTRAFEKLLALSLRRPLVSAMVIFVLPALGFYGAGKLTEQFFPVSDRDMFHIQVYLPESASLDASRDLADELYADITARDGVVSVHWFVGASAPSFYYNLVPTKDGAQFYAQAMVTVDDFIVADRLIPQLQKTLDDKYPQAQILVRKLEQGPPFDAPVEYRIYGPNLRELKRIGDELRLRMTAVDDVMHTRPTLGNATPKLWIDINEQEVERNGLSLVDVSRQLQAALDGIVGGSMLESTEELDVRVRLDQVNRGDLASLGDINLVAPRQASAMSTDDEGYEGIPLSAIANLSLQPNFSSIPRRDGERVNTIEAYIRDGVLPATVVQRINKALEENPIALPAGYRIELGGEGEKRNEAVGDLMLYVGVIMTMLVAVVVLSFNSFRLSAIIFAVAIQAAGLGLLSVYVFGYPFGFTVIIGLLGLIGLAINAAIVILAELKANPRAIRGDTHAIIHCVKLCARHITSTTITTVGGFLPLILGGGGFWPPFAVAIAGGTVLTTMLSFVFVPCVFYMLARKRPFELAGGAETPVAST
ncbi:Cobalt-zinc-cadmium resistance protein CzcA [BD1-7 clade bacterium]|uniref:Cobalt-zinc-cadmium resistance protein CzcA n=1 Tax=BD1-7 clade bacterium TaxID=2029982 RepID=A0A5S9QUT6_9GAMM|nr:Cobalt-zinc-cadmium resistance protein CzcA [BD1-7 clade bacterium]